MGLNAYLSPLAVWALAVGSAIGWGSFVVTGSAYLGEAGPLGSLVGTIIGGVVMVLVARCYHYMINRHPGPGGIYTYAKETFGNDHAFLVLWFAGLTYIAIFWANATSIPLFARYLVGDMFQFGYMYTLFGYDVYIGEVLLTVAAIVFIGVLCARSKRVISHAMVVLVLVFTASLSVCFGAAMFGLDLGANAFNPQFVPNADVVNQIVSVACMSSWAFIGFENVSNSSGEFAFSRKKTFRILAAAVIVTTLLYVFVTLLSATAYPERYESWVAYIGNLNKLSGLEALPAFYAAHHYLGDAGVALCIICLLALIITSLIGHIIALSRLFYASSQDGLLPRRLSRLNKRGIPENAVVAILLVSLIIPFVGRVAIGWIVDVTTIGATLVYGFLCAAVFRAARTNGDRIDAGVGFVGTVIMVVLAALVLLPNLTDASALASETYILIIAWCILGFIVFRFILRNDRDRRYGRSSVVWTVFLGVALFMAMAWMGEVNQAATDKVIVEIQAYYDGTADSPDYIFDKGAFIMSELRAMHDAQRDNTLMVALLFAIALIVMMVNYSFVRKREEESERRLGAVRDVAYRDPLTGVKSKHAFVEAEMVMDERISSGEDVAFSVVVCDINELKSMNDTKGHSAGDELIRSACALVCTTFKHSPVFRIGGDEFLALLEGSDYEWRDALIARLNDTVEENLANSGVVVSVGIADFIPGMDKKVRSVTDRADALMYERKRGLKKMAAARRA